MSMLKSETGKNVDTKIKIDGNILISITLPDIFHLLNYSFTILILNLVRIFCQGDPIIVQYDSLFTLSIKRSTKNLRIIYRIIIVELT